MRPPFIFKNYFHALSFLAGLALCLLGVYWEWRGAPVRTGGSWLWLKMLPLALCLPALWRASIYAMQGVSMLVLLYMAEGVIRGMGDRWPIAGYAWAEFGLAWLCFFGCILYVRPYKVAFKALPKAD